MENRVLVGLNRRPAGGGGGSGEAGAAVAEEAHDWRKNFPQAVRQKAVEILKERLIIHEFRRRYGVKAMHDVVNKERAALLAKKEEKKRRAAASSLNRVSCPAPPQDSQPQSPVSDLAASLSRL